MHLTRFRVFQLDFDNKIIESRSQMKDVMVLLSIRKLGIRTNFLLFELLNYIHITLKCMTILINFTT